MGLSVYLQFVHGDSKKLFLIKTLHELSQINKDATFSSSYEDIQAGAVNHSEQLSLFVTDKQVDPATFDIGILEEKVEK